MEISFIFLRNYNTTIAKISITHQLTPIFPGSFHDLVRQNIANCLWVSKVKNVKNDRFTFSKPCVFQTIISLATETYLSFKCLKDLLQISQLPHNPKKLSLTDVFMRNCGLRVLSSMRIMWLFAKKTSSQSATNFEGLLQFYVKRLILNALWTRFVAATFVTATSNDDVKKFQIIIKYPSQSFIFQIVLKIRQYFSTLRKSQNLSPVVEH